MLLRVDRLAAAPAGVRTAASELARLAERVLGRAEPDDEERLRRALLAGYPDRVARRREPGSPRLLLASGTGAVLDRSSAVRGGEYLLALEVTSSDRGGAGEALVRLASRIEKDWLEPTGRDREHRFDAAGGEVRAVERRLYGAIVLDEQTVPPDPAEAARLLVEAIKARGMEDDDTQLLRRLAFAGTAVDADALLAQAATGMQPTGRSRPPGAAAASRAGRPRPAGAGGARRAQRPPPSARLPRRRQRLPGGQAAGALRPGRDAASRPAPRAGGHRAAGPQWPAGPDYRRLASFWSRTYPEVRRELRARYPRHPWPEDPWTAPPTAATVRRRRP